MATTSEGWEHNYKLQTYFVFIDTQLCYMVDYFRFIIPCVMNSCILNTKYYIHNKWLLDGDNVEVLHFLYVFAL